MTQYTLPLPVTVTVQPQGPAGNQYPSAPTPVTITQLTRRVATDNPAQKEVSVMFFETRLPVVVWDGDAYDAAGQWTDIQLDAAIQAAINVDPQGFVAKALNFTAPDQATRVAIAARIRGAFPNGVPRPSWVTPITPAGVSGATGPVVQPQAVPAP